MCHVLVAVERLRRYAKPRLDLPRQRVVRAVGGEHLPGAEDEAQKRTLRAVEALLKRVEEFVEAK